MPEQNGPANLSDSSNDLDDLERKLDAARARRAARTKSYEDKDPNEASLLGMAWRLSTEFIVSVGVGWLLGYGLDRLFGTAPFIMLAGLAFGIAAGFMSVFRTARAMEEKTAHIPKGEDLPDDEFED